MQLGWAIGRVLVGDKPAQILVGKDTRISGYMFESALEAGLAAAGIDIGLLGPMPTPGIAYLTKNTHAQAGIVISASHNPFDDNGIKIFFSDGTKLSDALEHEIEQTLDLPMTTVYSDQLGKASRIRDAARRYIEYCKAKITDTGLLRDLKIVVDCANGATYQIAPTIFEELGATVIAHAISPNGFNINDQCGATAPQALQQLVKQSQADVGIAFDGDGDRLIMVDEMGNIIDGDEIIYIIAQEEKETLNGGVVGTVMSNLGLEQAINALGLKFLRADVGDRYVIDLLKTENLTLGGEPSGHIINLDLSTTGDGIIAALQVLQIMANHGKRLSELVTGMVKFPQIMKNIRLQQKTDIQKLAGIDIAIKAAEDTLGGAGRVVLRASGTEPLIRIMVEGESETIAQTLVDQLVDQVTHIVAK